MDIKKSDDFDNFKKDKDADEARAAKYKVIGVEDEEFKGVTVQVPLTMGCVVCDQAYAKAGPFMCGGCRRDDYSDEGWNELRIMVLSSVGTNE